MIESEDEFVELMGRLDREAAGTPLAGRFIRLLCMTVREHPEDAGLLILDERTATSGDYTGESLYAHIKDWCDARYGSKQAVPIDTGKLVLDLRGHRWLVQVPLILVMRNKFTVTYEVDGPPDWRDGNLRVINMWRYFVDLPSALACELQEVPLREELSLFGDATCAINHLRQCETAKFVTESIADFRAVGPELAKEHGAFGQCRWASLQFIEKSLKAFINLHGEVEWTHNLSRLAGAAQDLGMPVLEPADLDAAQCDAGVRYGEPVCTAEDALAAHHASVRLTAVISRTLAEHYARHLTTT